MSVGQGTLWVRPVSTWRLSAACRTADGRWFFAAERERAASRTARTARAKAVCAGCPVVAECRTHALETKEPFGIWGGLTEDERAAALRARRRAQLRLNQSAAASTGN
jgi:WhiB family transcriptional regulator, redox-sensing transcriptional regulator